MEEDGKKIRNFFEEIKNYDKLIIDIRGNSGGANAYWIKNIVMPLANEELYVENYKCRVRNYTSY